MTTARSSRYVGLISEAWASPEPEWHSAALGVLTVVARVAIVGGPEALDDLAVVLDTIEGFFAADLRAMKARTDGERSK